MSALLDSVLSAVASGSYHDDPYPLLAELRRREPVSRVEHGAWLLTRYEDVDRVIRDRGLGRAPAGWVGAGRPGERRHLPVSLLEGARHARVRACVAAAMPRSATAPQQSAAHELASELAERLADEPGEVDLVTRYALPYAFDLACEMFAIPAEDRTAIAVWGKALASAGDPPFLLDERTIEEGAIAQREFARYLAELIVRRRRRAGGDLISRLVTAEHGAARLDFAELVANGIFLVITGYHNTVNLIANALLALLEHPSQRELLAREPHRIGAAIRELARFDSPIHAIGRFSQMPSRIGGMSVPAGESLIALVGAAQRDPGAYDEPDLLDIGRRSARPLLTFGVGEYSCLGTRLAFRQAEIAVATLLQQAPGIALDGEPVRARTFTLRGLVRLPVRMRSAEGIPTSVDHDHVSRS
ncbi:MAG: cytochrome P450 [Solirubrobacteraceae bacterium]